MSQALRRLRVRLLWLATLAILFGSLAPSLSAALASSPRQAWAEICTSTGVKLIAIDAGDSPEEHNSSHTGVHCPYCRLQQDLPAIAHAASVLVLLNSAVRRVPAYVTVAPPRLAILWPAHHSRAPPFFS